MIALNRKKMTFILMLLTVPGYICISIGSSGPEMVPEKSDPLRIHSGDRFPDEPAIRIYDHGSRSNDLLLSQWLANRASESVVAILNRRLPEHFAQLEILKRIAASEYGNKAVFLLVDLQRIPGKYPAHKSPLNSRTFHYFSAGLETIAKLNADPSKPLIFFINQDLTVLHIANEYIGYPEIIRYVSMLTDTGQQTIRKGGEIK